MESSSESWGDCDVNYSTKVDVPPPRSVDVIKAEVEAIKAEISAKQKIQSSLFRELKAAEALLNTTAAPPVAAPPVAAPAAAAAPTAVEPVVLAPAPAFNLVIPDAEPAQRTMLFLIGRDGEKSPSQAKWGAQWKAALTHVQALPREQYSDEFAKIKKQFEDAGCRFEKRPVVPRGDGPARGGRGGGRGGAHA